MYWCELFIYISFCLSNLNFVCCCFFIISFEWSYRHLGIKNDDVFCWRCFKIFPIFNIGSNSNGFDWICNGKKRKKIVSDGKLFKIELFKSSYSVGVECLFNICSEQWHRALGAYQRMMNFHKSRKAFELWDEEWKEIKSFSYGWSYRQTYVAESFMLIMIGSQSVWIY